MAAKKQTADEALFDSRVVERHIAAGRVDRANYEAWLAKLDDTEEEGESTETDFVATAGVTNKTDLSAEERR